MLLHQISLLILVLSFCSVLFASDSGTEREQFGTWLIGCAQAVHDGRASATQVNDWQQQVAHRSN